MTENQDKQTLPLIKVSPRGGKISPGVILHQKREWYDRRSSPLLTYKVKGVIADMKRVQYVYRSALCFLICLLFTEGLFTEGVCAENLYRLTLPKTFWIGQDEEWLQLTDGGGGTVPIDTITQSNPGIFRVRKDPFRDEKDIRHYDVYIKPARAGSTTFEIGFTDEDGTSHVMRRTFTVKKYPGAIEELRVNDLLVKTGKKAKLLNGRRSDTRFVCSVKIKEKTGTVRIKTKKGWRISSVSSWLGRGNDDDIRDYKKVTGKSITKKTVMTGKRIAFPETWETLVIVVTLKNKNSEAIDYRICFERKA